MSRVTGIVAASIVALLAAALAFGSASDGERASQLGPPAPAVAVTALADGKELAFRDLIAADRPTLLWFWAPWCGVCNAEAAHIQQLAAEHGDELSVVAIGGRDNIRAGRAFRDQHELDAPNLVFDEPHTVWEAYGIPAQPAAVLLDQDGRERDRWYGPVTNDVLLERAREITTG